MGIELACFKLCTIHKCAEAFACLVVVADSVVEMCGVELCDVLLQLQVSVEGECECNER